MAENKSNNKSINKSLNNITVNDKDDINEMLSIADKKAKNFFDIIYSNATSSMNKDNNDEDDDANDVVARYEKYYSHNQNEINYGNLKDKYDSVKSVTSIDSVSEALKREIEQNEYQAQLEFSKSVDLLNLIKNNTKLISSNNCNLNTLNFTRESSIINIIERNRQILDIVCPYDEYSLFKLDSKITIRNFNEYQKTIKPINSIESYRLFSINESENESKNILSFLPNSLASLTMPFFFDIFQPSELKLIQASTIDIIIRLKNFYTPRTSLSNKFIYSNVPKDILWNCFALFKLKFANTSFYKNGFVNYYLSQYALVDYLNQSNYNDTKLIDQINKLLPYYGEALILNGLFNLKDLNSLKTFYHEINRAFVKNQHHLNIKVEKYHVCYIKKALDSLEKVFFSHYPMKLKNMCRISLKSHIISNFNLDTVYSNKEVKLDVESKHFLFFKDEFEQFFNLNKDLFISNN